MSVAPAAVVPDVPVSTFTSEQIQKWELGVALLINNWRAMVDAVSCQWGGPDSADKRDWLCGAIADMFVERPETDAEDVEDVLVQVMADEFDVNLEDDSAYVVSIQWSRSMAERMEADRWDIGCEVGHDFEGANWGWKLYRC